MLGADVVKSSKSGASGGASGGIVVTEFPLELFKGVAGEAPSTKGVAFEVTVGAVDSRWRDGLAIGFTAQNPDDWPSNRAKPKRASHMSRAWVGGYNGRWFFERRAELVRSVGMESGAWSPGQLACGDVVTAVAVGEPQRSLRIFVNGQLVAEESFKKASFPNPSNTPLWGVVDLDGSCVKVSLSASGMRRSRCASAPNLAGPTGVVDMSALPPLTGQAGFRLPLTGQAGFRPPHTAEAGFRRF
jgi:hypothetical protein